MFKRENASYIYIYMCVCVWERERERERERKREREEEQQQQGNSLSYILTIFIAVAVLENTTNMYIHLLVSLFNGISTFVGYWMLRGRTVVVLLKT